MKVEPVREAKGAVRTADTEEENPKESAMAQTVLHPPPSRKGARDVVDVGTGSAREVLMGLYRAGALRTPDARHLLERHAAPSDTPRPARRHALSRALRTELTFLVLVLAALTGMLALLAGLETLFDTHALEVLWLWLVGGR